MLHDVGDEDRLAIDPCRLERLVEDPAGRPDERSPFEILVVARLLADEHPARRHGPLPEDGLGRPRPQVTGSTAGGDLRDGRQVDSPVEDLLEDVRGSRVDGGGR